MPPPELLKRDWSKDHVYLIQYPRCKVIPNVSPWSLKLETWLRMADLTYTNISNEFSKFSAKGQVPFIELNGRQIADSSHIIASLEEEFHKTSLSPKSPEERALSRALTALIEDSLIGLAFAYRAKDVKMMFSEDVWGRQIGAGVKAKALRTILIPKLKKKMTARLHVVGAGRLTEPELEKAALDAIGALSTLLAAKHYFFGYPTTVDATAFSVLAQLYYTCQNPDIIKAMDDKFANLGAFVKRMRTEYWPDWEATCESMDMNTDWKKAKEGAANE